MSTPPKDEVAVVCPPDRNSDACGQVLFDAAAAPIRSSLPLLGRHPIRVAAPCGSPTRPGSSSRIPTPGGYHGYATCRHRRPATPYMVDLTGCLYPTGGGSRNRGNTWRPRSYPKPGGGSRSHGDTWHTWSCPAPRGEC
jgi:hypothetical protein